MYRYVFTAALALLTACNGSTEEPPAPDEVNQTVVAALDAQCTETWQSNMASLLFRDHLDDIAIYAAQPCVRMETAKAVQVMANIIDVSDGPAGKMRLLVNGGGRPAGVDTDSPHAAGRAVDLAWEPKDPSDSTAFVSLIGRSNPAFWKECEEMPADGECGEARLSLEELTVVATAAGLHAPIASESWHFEIKAE